MKASWNAATEMGGLPALLCPLSRTIAASTGGDPGKGEIELQTRAALATIMQRGATSCNCPIRRLTVAHHLTGNAGLYHVARELSRRGWHVMPTVRNAREADLYAANADESVVLAIQSKALSRRVPVPLGKDLETFRSRWWVVTIDANTSAPTCYVLTLDEVKSGAHRGVNDAGKVSYWLQPRVYALPEYREAWDRLGASNTRSLG